MAHYFYLWWLGTTATSTLKHTNLFDIEVLSKLKTKMKKTGTGSCSFSRFLTKFWCVTSLIFKPAKDAAQNRPCIHDYKIKLVTQVVSKHKSKIKKWKNRYWAMFFLQVLDKFWWVTSLIFKPAKDAAQNWPCIHDYKIKLVTQSYVSTSGWCDWLKTINVKSHKAISITAPACHHGKNDGFSLPKCYLWLEHLIIS